MTDLAAVPQHQQQTHEALENWARWCGSGRGHRGDQHPMFRGYVPYLYPEVGAGGQTVDTLAALAVQRAFVGLSDKHRWALNWCYCYPFIAPGRVQRGLGVTRAALCELITDARQMVGNRIRSEALVTHSQTDTIRAQSEPASAV